MEPPPSEVCEDEDGILQHHRLKGEEGDTGWLVPIDKLTWQGISPRDVEKLRGVGVYTCNSLMKHTKKCVARINGLSEEVIDKIFEAADLLLNAKFIKGRDLFLKWRSLVQVTPRSQPLDEEEEEPVIILENNEPMESIDKLMLHGINKGVVKKLKDVGIYTCIDLMSCSKKRIKAIEGLSEANFDRIYIAGQKILGCRDGRDLLIKRNCVKWVATGSQALDELLCDRDEDISNHPVIKMAEKFRSGKTLLTHTMCVASQVPMCTQKLEGKVAYIDTGGFFNPHSIVPIAERFGVQGDLVLDNIIYARAYTYEHVEKFISDLDAKMAEEPVKLLIIDSLTILFKAESKDDSEHAECQQKLARMLSRLTKIADESDVAVYITYRDGGVVLPNQKSIIGSGGISEQKIDTICDLQMKVAACAISKNLKCRPRIGLLGGARPTTYSTLGDFLYDIPADMETIEDGVRLYSNLLIKEILVAYPRGDRDWSTKVRTVTTSLANTLYDSIIINLFDAHADNKTWGGEITVETFMVKNGRVVIAQQPLKNLGNGEELDSQNTIKDYKAALALIMKCTKFRGRQPIYMDSLVSFMSHVPVSLAKNKLFKLFLRTHPVVLPYSIRSAMLWEIQRTYEGLSHKEQYRFRETVDKITWHQTWWQTAKTIPIFKDVYLRRTYRHGHYHCYKFIRNWLTHGKEYFSLAHRHVITSRSMDFFLEEHFPYFIPDLMWELIDENFGNLNQWFMDLQPDI